LLLFLLLPPPSSYSKLQTSSSKYTIYALHCIASHRIASANLANANKPSAAQTPAADGRVSQTTAQSLFVLFQITLELFIIMFLVR
jgi:hypothetical protein